MQEMTAGMAGEMDGMAGMGGKEWVEGVRKGVVMGGR